MKRCRYSKCKKLLTILDESVEGCCNKLHSRLAKQEYNKLYYGKSKMNKRIILVINILKTCIDQFGEDTEFDANFLELLKMDWEIETDKVVIRNQEYIAVGPYAYIVSKTQKVKIIRL